MAAAASTHGWSGDGSLADPYIIEGMDINGTGYGHCLVLKDVRDYIIIRDNRFHDTDNTSGSYHELAAIGINGCRNVTIENNTIVDHATYGILYRHTNGLIHNNPISGCDWAIDCHTPSDELTVVRNDLIGNANGISVGGPVIVEHNTITGRQGISVYGIRDDWGTPRSFSYNTVSDFAVGISFDSAIGKFKGNTIRDCYNTAIRCAVESYVVEDMTVINSSNGIILTKGENVLRNNTLVNAPVYLSSFDEDELRSHTIHPSTTVNGKPIQYLMDATDVEIDPATYDESILVNCSGISVRNITLQGVLWFYPSFCDNITIENNQLTMSLPIRWRTFTCDDVVIRDNVLDNLGFYTHGVRYEAYNNSVRHRRSAEDLWWRHRGGDGQQYHRYYP